MWRSLALVGLTAALCEGFGVRDGAQARETRILVIGGNGRVGGSTVRWLETLAEERPRLIVGGRSRASFDRMVSRWRASGGSGEAEFREVDAFDASSLDAALRDVDAVVHTAGPFQGVRRPAVLEAAIRRGNLVYVDACDETELCGAALALDEASRDAGVAAVVSGGIWPGASALMAMDCLERFGETESPSLDLSFFTAGTGGAGPTIVSATFLLLVTPAAVVERGLETSKEAWTEPKVVDFGGDVGRRTVRLLDCPDVTTINAAIRGAGRRLESAESRFATSPDVWNSLFGATKALLPPSLLADRAKMQALAVFSQPVIRAVDALVGSTNVMRLDASTPERTVTALHRHQDLEAAVGIATAAFVLELLRRPPRADASADAARFAGVRWPAQLDSDLRRDILDRLLRAPGTLEYSITDSAAPDSTTAPRQARTGSEGVSAQHAPSPS